MIDYKNNSGFTLIELVLIIVIIGIVASVAFRSMTPAVEQARIDSTLEEMESLTSAIIGDKNLVSAGRRTDFGYVGDVGALPPGLDALVSNPGGYSTWNGPYILNDFMENPTDFREDAWGDPYTYSGGVVISSQGNGTPINKQFAQNASDLTSLTVNGNIYDGMGAVPGDSAVNVFITVFYPDGSGSSTVSTVNPSNSGQFAFTGMIPIGNHLLRAVYTVTDDTLATYITVLPGNDSFCELRFSAGYW